MVVNYRKTVGKDGKVTMKPLSPAEITQITNLVKEAMGYNQERGDTLNVVNSSFASQPPEIIPDVPLWKQPQTIDMALQAGKYMLMAVALLLLYLRMLKPMLKKIAEAPALPAPGHDAHLHHGGGSGDMMALPGQRNYQENLARAQKLASEDPRVVANIVKTWVGSHE